ncbi:DUF2637 domain-containing protein [Stackebrandtia soli]|uniref:DUF2637 domain-containing protein n=1 Tax=Stackebrandtia soli TaxID=1892856 RepID=UPI0039E95A75
MTAYDYTPPPPGARLKAKAEADVMRMQAETASQAQTAQINAKVAADERLAKIEAGKLKAQAKAEKERLSAALDEERRQRTAARKARAKKIAAEKRDRIKAAFAENGAGIASTAVYVVALGAATAGQVSTAVGMGLPWGAGLGFAAFIEGFAIAAALSAHRLRVAGRRATLPQVLAWAMTAVAAAVQYYGHKDPPLLGMTLATASIAAVVMFELRSTVEAKLASKVRPPVRWGFRRWLVAPIETCRGWRADVLSRTTEDGQSVLAGVVRSGRARHRLAAAAADAYAAVSAAAYAGHLTSVRIEVVPDTHPASAVTTATGHPAIGHASPSDLTGLSDTPTASDTPIDPDGPDTGWDALYVPDWTTVGLPEQTQRLIDAVLSDLRTSDPDPEGCLTLLIEDAETGFSDTVSDIAMLDFLAVSDASDDDRSDTASDTPEVSDDNGSDTASDTPEVSDQTPRRRLVGRKPKAKKASEPVASDAPRTRRTRVDPNVIAAAKKRLIDAGRNVSARTLASETTYSVDSCHRWMKQQNGS